MPRALSAVALLEPAGLWKRQRFLRTAQSRVEGVCYSQGEWGGSVAFYSPGKGWLGRKQEVAITGITNHSKGFRYCIFRGGSSAVSGTSSILHPMSHGWDEDCLGHWEGGTVDEHWYCQCGGRPWEKSGGPEHSRRSLTRTV